MSSSLDICCSLYKNVLSYGYSYRLKNKHSFRLCHRFWLSYICANCVSQKFNESIKINIQIEPKQGFLKCSLRGDDPANFVSLPWGGDWRPLCLSVWSPKSHVFKLIHYIPVKRVHKQTLHHLLSWALRENCALPVVFLAERSIESNLTNVALH